MNYHGLPARTLENAFVRLQVLMGAGPRIVGLFLAGSDTNLLAETPDIHWLTQNGEYFLYGGHRLWTAPEIKGWTDLPDSELASFELFDGGVCLVGAPGKNGLQKTMEILLDQTRPAITIRHLLTNTAEPIEGNTGDASIEAAPWAITQLPLGGTILLPLPDLPTENPLLPNRLIALWPYTRLDDPRLEIRQDFIHLHAQADPDAIKVGCWNAHGWAAYERNNIRLVKFFDVDPQQNVGDARYPDSGCNVEAYCRNRFCELETLGRLQRLKPGETAVHRETWEIVQV